MAGTRSVLDLTLRPETRERVKTFGVRVNPRISLPPGRYHLRIGARDEVAYVYAFENRGEEIGVTLHHPHGQVYAFDGRWRSGPPLPRALYNHSAVTVGREVYVLGGRLMCSRQSSLAS